MFTYIDPKDNVPLHLRITQQQVEVMHGYYTRTPINNAIENRLKLRKELKLHNIFTWGSLMKEYCSRNDDQAERGCTILQYRPSGSKLFNGLFVFNQFDEQGSGTREAEEYFGWCNNAIGLR